MAIPTIFKGVKTISVKCNSNNKIIIIIVQNVIGNDLCYNANRPVRESALWTSAQVHIPTDTIICMHLHDNDVELGKYLLSTNE